MALQSHDKGYILWSDSSRSVAKQGRIIESAGYKFKYFASTKELIDFYKSVAPRNKICGVITSALKKEAKAKAEKTGVEMIQHLKQFASSRKLKHADPVFAICSVSIKHDKNTKLVSSSRDDIQRKVVHALSKQHKGKASSGPLSVAAMITALSNAEKDALRIRHQRDANKVVSLCNKMESNMHAMEQQLGVVVGRVNTKKQHLDKQLEANRGKYAKAEQAISRKQREIDSAAAELSAKQSRLHGLQNQISELERDIDRKRREKRRKEEQAVAVGVGVGLLTFGFGGAVAASATTAAVVAMVNEIKRCEKQANELKDMKRGIENDINNTRAAKQAKENEMSSLKQQLSRQRDEKAKLGQESKTLGRQIVAVSNAGKNMQEAAMKCKQIRDKVETVRELTDDGLMEFIHDPLNQLLSKIHGAKSNLDKVKMLKY
mmetsp:Transcript_21234/g.33952  ORF Transcript_21234/g.33952 Transcript_21234/m.33952 type:complete len:433 (+) Transcript_21234:79-1377(+)